MVQQRAGAYLYHWYSFRSLRTQLYSKDTAQVSAKYLSVLECTSSTATHINTKDGYTASNPKVVATHTAAGHVRDVLIESKTSSGILSLPDNAQGYL